MHFVSQTMRLSFVDLVRADKSNAMKVEVLLPQNSFQAEANHAYFDIRQHLATFSFGQMDKKQLLSNFS